MKNINLLPRKPLVERRFPLLLIATIGAGLVLTLLNAALWSYFDDGGRSSELQSQELDKRIESLSKSAVPDERSAQYDKAYKQVAALVKQRPDWMTDIAYVIGFLPRRSSIQSMDTDSNGLLKMELHFVDEEDVVQYLARLQSEPGYFSLKVDGLTREKGNRAKASKGSAASSGATGQGTANATQTAATARFPAVVTAAFQSKPQAVPNAASFITASMSASASTESTDLTSEIERLLKERKQATGDGASDGSAFLGEDSPFTRDEVEQGLSQIRGGSPSVDPPSPPSPEPSPQPSASLPSVDAEPAPSPQATAPASAAPRTPQLEDESYLKLLLEVQLHSTGEGVK